MTAFSCVLSMFSVRCVLNRGGCRVSVDAVSKQVPCCNAVDTYSKNHLDL